MDVSTEIHFYHVQTNFVSELVLLANTASKWKEQLLCRPSLRGLHLQQQEHTKCVCLCGSEGYEMAEGSCKENSCPRRVCHLSAVSNHCFDL